MADEERNEDAHLDPALPRVRGIRLERELARGGQGVVYLGRQLYLDRTVAVKFLHPEQQSPSFVKRFRREARTLAGMRHPNIVGCYEAGTCESGHVYLVMEYVDGKNLREWVAEHGPLPVGRAFTLCSELASALDHARAANVIHRDVKPENVLMQRREDGGFTAKLADLGMARSGASLAETSRLTPQSAIVGTPSTMAPEQFDRPQDVDFRADVYGLGCVLYHALTGSPAFGQEHLTELMAAKRTSPDVHADAPHVPPEAAQLVHDMLNPDREARPDYAAILERCATAPTEPSSAGSRRRLLVGALAAGAVAVVAALRLGRGDAPERPGLARGEQRQLFGTALDERRYASWTISSEASRWGPDEERPRAVHSNSRPGMPANTMRHELPAGAWELTGVLEPREAYQVGLPRSLGVLLQSEGGEGVALVCTTAKGAAELSVEGRATPAGSGPDACNAGERVGEALTWTWQEGDTVTFRMRFDGSVLRVKWTHDDADGGTLERATAPPTTVTVFVEGGNACFADFVVTGR